MAMLPVNLRKSRRRLVFWWNRTLCMLRLQSLGAHHPQRCAISVITPTYRRLPLLAEAIDSVLAQTFQDWEHIIIADGHDPEVESLVNSYSDDRLRYLFTRRFSSVGHYQRNVALAHARGDFMIFLDDDNVILPHALATLIAGFDEPGIGFVIGPVAFDEQTVLLPRPDFGLGEVDTLNFMIRRHLFALVGGWRNTYQADYLIIDAIRRVARGRYLDGPIIGYHR